MKIKGKNILITGAGRRIGKFLSVFLARKGGNIVIHYNSSEREALKLAVYLKQKYQVKVLPVKADLTRSDELFKLIETVKARWGHIDILINNASLYFKTPLEDVEEETLDVFLAIHLKAPFFLSKEFGKIMYERKEGRIINIVDYSPLRPYKDFSAYIISKGALLTLTKVFAKEFAPYVLVNGILPGPIVPAEGIDDKLKPLEKTLLKKWGGEVEIAKAVNYLIESELTTGGLIPVEAGRLIC